MVELRTDLRKLRESARTERVELSGTITATQVQQALQDLDTGKLTSNVTTLAVGNLTVSTTFTDLGTATLSSLTVSGTAVVFGATTLSTLAVSSTVLVLGDSTLSSLTVTNAIKVFGGATLSALTVTNAATVFGNATVSGLTVTNAGNLGSLSVTGTATVFGNATLSSLTVTNAALLGSLTVTNSATVSALSVTNNATVFGVATVSSLTVTNAIAGFGNTTLSALTVTNAALVGSLTVTTTASVLGIAAVSSLSVTATATVFGAATVSSLIVSNTAVINSTLTVLGNETVSGSLVVPTIAGGTTTNSQLVIESTLGAGTGDTIIFKTASQSQRASIATGGNVGIGATVPQVQLDVSSNANAASIPAITSGGSLLRLINADSTVTGLQMDSIGGVTAFHARRSDGTFGAQTGLVLNDIIFSFRGYGFTSGGAYTATSRAKFEFIALETWTATANGAAITFSTTPIGAVSPAEAARISGSGGISIGTTTDSGAGGLLAIGNATVSSLTVSNGFTLPIGGSFVQSATALTLTASSVSSAILSATTQNLRAGKITTTALTSAANSTFSLLITNSIVSTTDTIVWGITNGTNTAVGPLMGSKLQTAGAVTLIVNTISALNGTLIFDYSILK